MSDLCPLFVNPVFFLAGSKRISRKGAETQRLVPSIHSPLPAPWRLCARHSSSEGHEISSVPLHGMRAIRYYGFCHPAAKRKRERIAFHTGRPLLIGALATPLAKPKPVYACPCCGKEMKIIARILPPWLQGRAPPRKKRRCA